jgi:hypothetical protein
VRARARGLALTRLTRCAGGDARAAIDGAVQLLRTAQPPLLGEPLSVCLKTLTAITSESKAAWVYAERAGVYDGVVRSADAYPDSEEVQYLTCGGLSLLGTQTTRECWPGHSAAGARAGPVRVVAAALRKHGLRSTTLLSTTATALVGLLEDANADDWESARSGHVGMSLAAGLAVAVRDTTAVATLEALNASGAPHASLALMMASRDEVCALEAARGGALHSLAVLLRIPSVDLNTASQTCIAMQQIAEQAPDAVRERTADAGVAALRFAIGMHHSSIVQLPAWIAVKALLEDDNGAQRRAVATGVMTDIVRTLKRSVEVDADEDAALAAEGACSLLNALTNNIEDLGQKGNREAAEDAGAVPVVLTVIRKHGCTHSRTAFVACSALAGLVHRNLTNASIALRARPYADLVAVMRAHSSELATALTAAMTLVSLVIAHFMVPSKFPRSAAVMPTEFASTLMEAGVLEVATDLICQHTHAPGTESAALHNRCLDLLVCTCTGTLPMEGGSEPLQPSIAARAKRAGVEAALSAVLARTPPPPLPAARAAAERLLAALAKVRLCDGCGTADAAKLMRCSRCLAARFCGQACMRSSWPAHKLVCVPAAAEESDE